jgi:hypothetical protein
VIIKAGIKGVWDWNNENRKYTGYFGYRKKAKMLPLLK